MLNRKHTIKIKSTINYKFSISVENVKNALRDYDKTYKGWILRPFFDSADIALFRPFVNSLGANQFLDNETAFKLITILLNRKSPKGTASDLALQPLENQIASFFALCQTLQKHNFLTDELFKVIYNRYEYADCINAYLLAFTTRRIDLTAGMVNNICEWASNQDDLSNLMSMKIKSIAFDMAETFLVDVIHCVLKGDVESSYLLNEMQNAKTDLDLMMAYDCATYRQKHALRLTM